MSVGWSFGRSVGPSVRNAFVKNGFLRILNDLDSAGRGKKRDEEEGGTKRSEEEGGSRRKEERGGRRDEESEKKKNEKVAKGRIIGLAGPCLLL